MFQTWRVRSVVVACLLTAVGCNGTARPMLFHRNEAEPAVCCPMGPMATCEGPALEGMPMMGPAAIATPGMPMAPGTVTIPGPGVTLPPATAPPPIAAPPAPAPPVGPQPRTAPGQ